MNERDLNFNYQITAKQSEGQPQCDCPSFCIHVGLQKFLLAIELFFGDVPLSQFLLQDIQSGFVR